MKKYALAHCVNNPLIHQKTTWEDFEKIMRSLNVREAIIFPVDDDFSEAGLVKRAVIGQLIIKKDGVNFLDDYCIVSHEEKGLILPCIILLDPELEYAVVKAMEFRDNKFFIQCVITDDNQFHVNECGLDQIDQRFNLSMN